MEDLQEYFSALSFSFSPYSSSSFNLGSPSISTKCWQKAERRTEEILCAIQPSLASERRRKGVIELIQKLIKYHFEIEVFPFGSVPLKTYLPDGDIDMTAISKQDFEEDLARNICSILESEGQKETEFQVNNVRFICARVKIIKCTVENIAVDISFNQMAGLCTMCFLEQVDQLFGKDHLYKRSLILIKAWCYYESRILGAHHGLISTYALEILVLYIINLFHSSLHGPLAVLYKFMAYFSTFEWDNYCVTVNGPVPLSSLSENFENDGDELLLNKEILRMWRDISLDSSSADEIRGQEFPVKHLNIMDPLKGNNNLGRCVSKGNFYRIKCALAYGAQKLGEILLLGETMDEELKNFFMNILDRNGRGERPDVQVPVPVLGAGRFEVSDLSGDYNGCLNGLNYGQWYHGYTIRSPILPSISSLLSPSQILKNSLDSRCWIPQFNKNSFLQRNVRNFSPGLRFCHQNAQLSVSGHNVEEMRVSQGIATNIPEISVEEKAKSGWTGTYISDRDFVDISKLHRPDAYVSCMNTRKLLKPQESAIYFGSIRHSSGHIHPCAGEESGSSETDQNGNSSRFYLSLEDYPLLPRIQQPMLSKIRESGECNLNSLQAKDSSPSLESSAFGGWVNPSSPIELHSPETSKQLDTGASSTSDAVQNLPAIAESKPQESIESAHEKSSVHPYQLKNDKDFPPLGDPLILVRTNRKCT